MRTEDAESQEDRVSSLTITQQVQTMSVAEKVRFALHAGKDARSILIKDPNKQVAMAVVTSPKITEDEILLIAQSRNVDIEVLRTIAKNREWRKRNQICLALVSNPKTPLNISHSLLPSIKTKDLGGLLKNRNVPEAVRAAANKLFLARQR